MLAPHPALTRRPHVHVRVRCLDTGYNAADVVELGSFKNVKDWVARCEARPASKVWAACGTMCGVIRL
jgi:glutathione S-transferase